MRQQDAHKSRRERLRRDPAIRAMVTEFHLDRLTKVAVLHVPKRQGRLWRLLGMRPGEDVWNVVVRLVMCESDDTRVDTPGLMMHETTVRNLGVRPGCTLTIDQDVDKRRDHEAEVVQIKSGPDREMLLLVQWRSADHQTVLGFRHWTRKTRPELLPHSHD